MAASRRAWRWLWLGLLGACGAASPPNDEGPRVAVDVAALNLQGVGDVVWDVQVVNGRAPTPEVVWQRRLSSSGYGDGAGSASYVGPCDADPAVSTNEVRVWVVGVYSAPVSSLGSFAAGAPGGVAGSALGFENPTEAAPLTRSVTCRANADVAAHFDVALMRPAQQGFFDIAVNFNNVFCSAKFDCCSEEAGGTCGDDIALLFDAGGARASTMVLGFACTAGPRAEVDTELYLDPIQLDCTAPHDFATAFAADLVIDPSGPAGNQCTAGEVGGGACAPRVTSPTGADADDFLFQVALFRGVEDLTSGGVTARKVYWNVALGVNRVGAGSVGIEDCLLRTRGTADDANGSGYVDNGLIDAGTVYPYVQWEVDLASCAAEPLTFGSAGGMVRTEYTHTTDGATSFAYGYGASFGPGSFCAEPCVNGTCVGGACVCATGWEGTTCETDTDDCVGGACGAPAAGACVDGLGAFSCDCADGYYGSGTQACTACPVMAHCASGLTCTGPDPADASCDTCDSGYVEPSCGNIDECDEDPGLCGEDLGRGTCVDSDGSFSCSCASGYYGTGTQACTACMPVANCTAVTCSGPGASSCTACAAGFTLSGGACVAALSWYRMPNTLGGTLSSGPLGPNTVWSSEANAQRNYETVVLACDLTGSFDVTASFGHDYPAVGVVHGPSVSYVDVTGYSVDQYGPYFGGISTSGFPPGYSGAYVGQYLNQVNWGSNPATYWYRWTRSGNTLYVRYSTVGASGPWTALAGTPTTVATGDLVVIGVGEASLYETAPLRLLSFTGTCQP